MSGGGFRAVSLDKTVAIPTMGAFIGAGSYSLIDGSTAPTTGVSVYLDDRVLVATWHGAYSFLTIEYEIAEVVIHCSKSFRCQLFDTHFFGTAPIHSESLKSGPTHKRTHYV